MHHKICQIIVAQVLGVRFVEVRPTNLCFLIHELVFDLISLLFFFSISLLRSSCHLFPWSTNNFPVCLILSSFRCDSNWSCLVFCIGSSDATFLVQQIWLKIFKQVFRIWWRIGRKLGSCRLMLSLTLKLSDLESFLEILNANCPFTSLFLLI